MIAAIGKNNELGKDNKLIWHFKEDMAFFKAQTMGKPIVMGMNTYKSLPKVLSGRKNIVVTTKNIEIDNVLVMNDIQHLLKFIKEFKSEVMVIGGEKLYRQLFEYAHKLILTEIDDYCLDADTYFPEFNKNKWKSTIIGEYEENNIKYKHKIYTKK